MLLRFKRFGEIFERETKGGFPSVIREEKKVARNFGTINFLDLCLLQLLSMSRRVSISQFRVLFSILSRTKFSQRHPPIRLTTLVSPPLLCLQFHRYTVTSKPIPEDPRKSAKSRSSGRTDGNVLHGCTEHRGSDQRVIKWSARVAANPRL